MGELSGMDYSALDVPEVLRNLFHPRKEWGDPARPVPDVLIPVDKEVSVGSRFHMAGRGSPTILFFHGNGEIVADYDDIAPFYNRMGVHFVPVDYRGYGSSTGEPTVSAMMSDCHKILDFTRKRLIESGESGLMIVMGRSLGSACAIELAGTRAKEVDGLIVESGFALAGPLLKLLGANMRNFSEEKGFGNLEKIKRVAKPTLIIHAERDHIIPFADGQALYDASPSPQKTMLKVPGANHNDILFKDLASYMATVSSFVERLRAR